jgi:Domain of unknown function (DUF4328)
MGSVPLKRVGGVARFASVLCLVSAAFSVGGLLAVFASRDEARAYRAGGVSDTEFIESIAAYSLIEFAATILTIAAAVFTIIWAYRIASNHQALHRGTTWGPGWAIGGWFTPPFLWIIPTLMFREMWRASDPDVPVGGDWKSRPTSPLPLVWFLSYGVIPLVLLVVEIGNAFGSLSNTADQMSDQILGSQVLAILGAAATVVSAIVFVVFVRGLTQRHRRLTGEAVAVR